MDLLDYILCFLTSDFTQVSNVNCAIIPEAVAGLFGLGGSLLGGLSSLFGASSQNAANMKLAEYQNEWNYKMWQEQNVYNSPKQQMARFAEAGLNPNLIYGQGNSGNASGFPQAVGYQQTEGISKFGNSISQIIPQLQNLALVQEQINNAKKQGAQIDAQTEDIKARTAKTLYDTTFSKKSENYNLDFLSARLNQLKEQISSSEFERSWRDKLYQAKLANDNLSYEKELYNFQELRDYRKYRDAEIKLRLNSMDLANSLSEKMMIMNDLNIDAKTLENKYNSITLPSRISKNFAETASTLLENVYKRIKNKDSAGRYQINKETKYSNALARGLQGAREFIPFVEKSPSF